MNYDRCPICGEYDFVDRHKCKPIYEVCQPDYDSGYWRKTYANSFEDAAEKYAVYWNEESGEYSMMNGDPEIKVLVRKQDNPEKILTISVEAKPAVDYHIRILESEKQEDS